MTLNCIVISAICGVVEMAPPTTKTTPTTGSYPAANHNHVNVEHDQRLITNNDTDHTDKTN